MCLTAFIIGLISKEMHKTGYRMVLAFNRDEFYVRPAKPAAFWPNHDDVIGGMDMTPGKEGGTWLSMSKSGRLAFLLNIRRPDGDIADPVANKGRGSLVSDFVMGTQSGEEYLQAVAREADQYNGFNLVTVDLSKLDDTEVYYYCNMTDKPPQKLHTGSHAISNSHLDSPWMKALHAKDALAQTLSDVVEKSKEMLTEEILKVMRNDVPLSRDQPLDESTTTKEDLYAVLPELVCVKTPIYGTRSHTVILVDVQGEVTYTECYLLEPIDAGNRQWKSQTFTFNLESPDGSRTNSLL